VKGTRFSYGSWTLVLLAMIAAFSSLARAQVQTGQINGVAKDETGGALPGVTITVKSL